METHYTLTTVPLIRHDNQLRWNIDTSSNQRPLNLTNGRIEICGWLLAEGKCSPHLAIKNDVATYSFPFNVKRPDVVSAILQQPVDNHPHLSCGFKVHIPFSSQITIGLESGGLITWLEELNFTPVN